jgi:hypothetical protein
LGENLWSLSGSDIYYNAGNVSIGTASSQTPKLYIQGSTLLTGNVYIEQSNYTTMLNTQMGYTLTGTYSGTASDGGTPNAVGSFNLPPIQGVWIISIGWTISISNNDTISYKNITISETTASNTPLNDHGGWQYYDELNDETGSSLRDKGYLGGICMHNSTATKTIYINAACPTSGSRTVTVSGGYSATRIG